MTLSEKRSLISTLHKEYSVREICETLGFNRSSFYYHPQEDPSEELLRSEIEKLAGRYPRYGYRRITQLLQRQGYTVGTRRVAGLMKNSNLLVSVKRACQTTKSLQGDRFLGATASKPFRSIVRIRSGWRIFPMFVSMDVSSMSACSWMFSLG